MFLANSRRIQNRIKFVLSDIMLLHSSMNLISQGVRTPVGAHKTPVRGVFEYKPWFRDELIILRFRGHIVRRQNVWVRHRYQSCFGFGFV